MHLHPISVTCTVQLEPLCDEYELQEYHPTSSLAGPARHLVSLQVMITASRLWLVCVLASHACPNIMHHTQQNIHSTMCPSELR